MNRIIILYTLTFSFKQAITFSMSETGVSLLYKRYNLAWSVAANWSLVSMDTANEQ